jgi:two-component system, LytTR family, sensor kinase
VTGKQKIYWTCQLAGWTFYVIVNLLFFGLSYSASYKEIINYFLLLPIGIFLTHGLRFVIMRLNILQLQLYYQLLFIVFSSFVLSVLFFFFNFFIGWLLNIISSQIDLVFSLEVIINSMVPFTFWALIYFGFHYLQNYKKTEIQNLRWEATSKDIELNKLKSQLNPHFMFNSMNSIRALIDEDPAKAKEAVTQLSNILRNTLLMNKSREIELEEEVRIVKDYLALEKIRYEERLNYELNIEPAALRKMVPPLIVQAQVENAIKHGISKIPKGGTITVNAIVKDKELIIEVINSGQINSATPDTGFGLVNSMQRLELLYGDKGQISIDSHNENEVEVRIRIPVG